MNTPDLFRRRLLHLAAMVPLPLAAPCTAALLPDRKAQAMAALAALERSSGGRLGVSTFDTASGVSRLHRADERFPFCNIFSVIAVAAVLKRSEGEAPGWLAQQRIIYTSQDMAPYSPITQLHLSEGMTVDELCAATLQWSDNAASNLLIRWLGGPQAVTAFAHSIGDNAFRLDRRQPELSFAVPGDPRDTSTPAAMALSLHLLTLGDALAPASRQTFVGWLKGCIVGPSRIPAGVPAAWPIAHKTGSGGYGTTNDVAVLWPPGHVPLTLIVFFTQKTSDARAREDVVAAAARAVVQIFE